MFNTDENMTLDKTRNECKETDDCSDSMNQSSRDGDEPEASLEESNDQANVWAQQLFESQFLDLSGISPRGMMSPKFAEMGGLADFGNLCASPLFSDQFKFLQGWSPRVTPNTVPGWGSGTKTASTSENVSTSPISTESDPSSSDFMITSDSTVTGSGDDAKKTRKRKSVERDDGIDGSHGDTVVKELETSNSSSMKQVQKMKGPKRPREPRYEFKTRSEVDVIDDGYKWRKYGQKPVKSSPHPRNYYRCTTANCPVRKRVERSIEDPGLIVTSYEGTHTHPKINRPKNSTGGVHASNESEGPQDLWSQVQNRIPATTSGLQDIGSQQENLAHLLPNLGNLISAWPTLPFNLSQPPPPLQDNVSMIMAYQLVRLQFELQARIQQFMSYNAAQQSLSGGFSKNPFTGTTQGLPQFPLPDLTRFLQNYVDLAAEPKQIPTPEPLNPNSLLSRRLNAARLRTSSLNPNTQKSDTLRNVNTQQSEKGPQAAGPDLEEKLSGPGLPPRPSRST